MRRDTGSFKNKKGGSFLISPFSWVKQSVNVTSNRQKLLPDDDGENQFQN